MAHKVIIHDVVAVARAVEIPEVCPKCHTPLHDKEAHPVRHWELHDVQHVGSFESADTDGDEPDYLCDDDDGDTFVSNAYYCQCGYCFTEGSLVILDSENPRGKPVRDIIDLET